MNKREMKFRAWDCYDGRMMPSFGLSDLSGEGAGGVSVDSWMDQGLDWRAVWNDMDRGYVIMQYTGLKDKNGKEIYDGDIVKFYDKELLSRWRVEQVQWDDYEWVVNGTEYFTEKEYKIIGNIYEDSHLLKEGHE